jgi:hypothetical protein
MSLALLIASLVATAIGSIKGIPGTIGTAIGSITSVLGVLIKNGVGTSATAPTESIALAALAAVIAQLQADTSLSAEAKADLTLLSDALTAALSVKVTSVDPTKLQPITPVA